MRALLELPLICLSCRVQSERGFELHSLVADPAGGVLQCSNPACARRYPVIDGIPLLHVDLAAAARRDLPALTDAPLAALLPLVEAGPDDAPLAQLTEHLSIYLDAHWADYATPPLDPGLAPLLAQLARDTERPAFRQLELGCSVGRALATLAGRAPLTVGLDLHLGSLRRARRLLDGTPVAYLRRNAGRHYSLVNIIPPAPAFATHLVCGDALDPPFAPGSFDRVVALNLLDAVPDPRQLLTVVEGLLASGGQLLLASPFAWSSTIVAEGTRIGAHDPAAALAALLAGGFTVDETHEIEWQLRRDDRSSVHYRTHYLRATKR